MVSSLWVPATRSALCDVLILVDQSAEPVVSSDGVDSDWGVAGEGPSGSGLAESAVRPVIIVKSVRGAVPVFRPVRFLGPLPEPAGRLSPQRALHRSQVDAPWWVMRRPARGPGWLRPGSGSGWCRPWWG